MRRKYRLTHNHKNKIKILVMMPVTEAHREILEEAVPGALFVYIEEPFSLPEPLPPEYRDAEVVIGSLPPALIDSFSALKFLQIPTAGYERYSKAITQGDLSSASSAATLQPAASSDLSPSPCHHAPRASGSGLTISNATGAYGLGISEYMIGMVLTLFKKLHLYRDNQSHSLWEHAGPVKSIYGASALVIGAGDIGTEFASRLKALGAAHVSGIKRDPSTLYNSPFSESDPSGHYDDVYSMDELDMLLPTADIVSLSLPSSPETDKIINSRRLALMKKDAILINVGRGNSVDTDALCDALENDLLLGAALDVTDPEPLPPSHRLWKMKNVLITPHVTGGYTLKETHDRIIRICAANIKAYSQGKAPSNIVITI